MKKIRGKIVIFLLIAVGILVLWGCSSAGTRSDAGGDGELNIKEELVVNFLYTLAVNYGESPYDLKLYDAKVYEGEGAFYYLAIDASVGGVNDGERRIFGNEIGFLEGEQITFSTREASAYKFFTDNNLAVSKGEKQDTAVILNAYSKLIEEKLDEDKKQEEESKNEK